MDAGDLPKRQQITFHFGYKNQPVYVMRGRSRCYEINTKQIHTVWAECQFGSFKPVGARNQQALKG